MEIDFPRDQYIILSSNNYRAILVHSDVFSIIYTEYIQAFTTNLAWANQVKTSEFKEPACCGNYQIQSPTITQ